MLLQTRSLNLRRILINPIHLPLTPSSVYRRNMSQNKPFEPPTAAQMSEHFEKVATTYEEHNGDVTNAICRQLIAFCGASGPFPTPITTTSVIHDNASGPGILAGEVLKLPEFSSGNVPKIHCTDFSPAMIRVLDAKGWSEKYGVESAVMDAQALSFPDEIFTHSFTNLALFALPEPAKGTKEIYRTLKPGGLALVTTIKHAGWLPPFQRAQKLVRPNDKLWPGMMAPEWSESAHLHGLVLEGGFTDAKVTIESFGVPFHMKDFIEKQGQLIATASSFLTKEWSEDETAKFQEALKEELQVESESNASRLEVWIAIAKK